MLQKGEKFQSRFINLIADIFLNSVLNQYLHLVLNLLHYLVVFGIIFQQEIFNINNIQTFNSYLITALILLILTVKCLILVIIAFLILFQKREIQQNVFIMEYEGYVTQKVKKIVALFLIVYRKVLGIFLLQFSIWVLRSGIQQVSISWVCTIVNLTLFTVLYLLSGVNFASKIAFMPNVVSFGYKTNMQTLDYGYLIIMIVINEFSPQILTYTNLIFAILCLTTIYIRPLILYRHNTVGLIGSGMTLGLLLARSVYQIFQIRIQTAQQYIWFVASTFFVALVIVKLAQKRMNFILLCKNQNTLLNKLNTWCKDQIIFYHFVNYESQQNSIFLYLLQELQYLKSEKVKQTSTTEGSQKYIIDHSADNTRKQTRSLIERIIQAFKSSSFNDSKVRNLLNQLIFLKYQSLYNPKLLMKLNLGKNEIQQQISKTQSLSMILGQILLLDEINFRRCYTFMKIHQSLLSRIGSLSLINKIEIHSLIQIVENNLKYKINTLKEYNLKAEQYFIFEQKFQQLKRCILKACEQKIFFWKQDLEKEPNYQKINNVLQDNYTIYTTIKILTMEITQQFKQKGPIILYNLIAAYSTKILNVKLFSSSNPFNSLIKKYEQQLVHQKKQGTLKQQPAIQKYSLLQSIGVCLVDLEIEQGKILWANEDFWTEFYLNREKGSLIQNTNEKNTFVFDLMLPQLVFKHKSYFKLFTQSQKVNHHHDFAFVYQKETKIINRISTQIQVFPSFRNGFNVTVFLFKNPENQTKLEKFTILVKQDLEIVGHTAGFLKEKINFAQRENKSNQIDSEERDYLTEQLATNEIFREFLLGNRNGNEKAKKQVQVCVKESQYKAKLLKIYSLNENVSSSVFLQNTGFVNDQETTQNKEFQKCMYFLQFQIDGKNEVIDKAETKQWSDLRSHASQLSSLSSIEADKILYDPGQHAETQDKLEESEKMDKKYKAVMFGKSSNIAKFWIAFIIIIGVLLIAVTISNIAVFVARQQFYEGKMLTIKYFNELLTDICQLCIALREYNYYAYVNGPNDPHVPMLISQLKSEQIQVEFKLNYLSGYINEKWSAMEVQRTVGYRFFLQDAYIVIANYMLSSMTYLGLVDPQQMGFPVFVAQYIDLQFTSAQVNFNQAIFNGIFVVLKNLAIMRAQFIPTILQDITSIKNQFYIYPSAIGILILFIFMIVSILVERKSENLREHALEMLAQLPERVILEKISMLQDFKHSNCFVLDDYLSFKKEKESKQNDTTITKTTSLSSSKPQKSTNNNISRLESFGLNNDKVCETQNETKRDLVGLEQEIYDLQPPDQSASNAKKISVIQSNIETYQQQDASRRPKIKLPQSRAQRWKIPIYLLLIAPCLSYFIVVIVRGFGIDSHIAFSFQMASQIYNKKSNQQLVFLLTRQTFYFQKNNLLLNYDWKQIVMNTITQTIADDRFLQSLISQNSQAANLQNLMGQYSNGNLCDKVELFNKSDYYGVNFSRQECLEVYSGLLQQGLKPTQNWYLQTAVEIISSVPDPDAMTIAQRYQFLKMPQLSIMKTLLAYLEQFMSITDENMETDLYNQIYAHARNIIIYSILAIASVVVVFNILRYRWNIVYIHKMEILSILELISLQSIKTQPKMKKFFDQMPLNIHN